MRGPSYSLICMYTTAIFNSGRGQRHSLSACIHVVSGHLSRIYMRHLNAVAYSVCESYIQLLCRVRVYVHQSDYEGAKAAVSFRYVIQESPLSKVFLKLYPLSLTVRRDK